MLCKVGGNGSPAYSKTRLRCATAQQGKKRKQQMKKLIIAAAIVCVAAISQAATVNWGVSGVKASGDAAPTAGWAVMAFYTEAGAGSAAIESAIASKTAGSLAFDAKAITVSMKKGKYGPADVDVAGLDTSKTYDFYFVVFNDADATKATDYVIVSDLNKTYSGMDAKFKGTGDFSTSPAWQPTSVPEPTSGLLMLLGVAGLALRRRRA